MEQQPALCLDFDGVLHTYRGWKGEDVFNRPLPGALKFCRKMEKRGVKLYALSVRPAVKVQAWLDRYGFPVEAVDTKPQAGLYVDDNGFRFRGDWQEVERAIGASPWWEKSLHICRAQLPIWIRCDRLRKGFDEDFSIRLHAKKWKDRLRGGKADNRSPEDFPKNKLRAGTRKEMEEHGLDLDRAMEVAMDHLTENLQYYERGQE